MVSAFSAKRADDPFAKGVLPGRLSRTDDLLDAECFDLFLEDIAEDRVTITVKEPWFFSAWESLDDLLGSPSRGRVLGDVEVDDAASIVREYDEDIKHFEGQRGNSEEVASCADIHVVADEGLPVLTRTIARLLFDHVSLNCGLGDIEAELSKLVSDSRRSPSCVLSRDALDQLDDLVGDWRPSARGCSGLSFPIVGETLAMPGQNGLGLYDDQVVAPVFKEAAEKDPESAVAVIQVGAGNASSEDVELLA